MKKLVFVLLCLSSVGAFANGSYSSGVTPQIMRFTNLNSDNNLPQPPNLGTGGIVSVTYNLGYPANPVIPSPGTSLQAQLCRRVSGFVQDCTVLNLVGGNQTTTAFNGFPANTQFVYRYRILSNSPGQSQQLVTDFFPANSSILVDYQISGGLPPTNQDVVFAQESFRLPGNNATCGIQAGGGRWTNFSFPQFSNTGFADSCSLAVTLPPQNLGGNISGQLVGFVPQARIRFMLYTEKLDTTNHIGQSGDGLAILYLYGANSFTLGVWIKATQAGGQILQIGQTYYSVAANFTKPNGWNQIDLAFARGTPENPGFVEVRINNLLMGYLSWPFTNYFYSFQLGRLAGGPVPVKGKVFIDNFQVNQFSAPPSLF